MQDRILNNLLDTIQELKEEYSKSMGKNNEYGDKECFMLEERLYKFVRMYFPEYFEEKMKLVNELMKNNKWIWEKALSYKAMPSILLENKYAYKTNRKFTENEKNIARYIYDNLLCQYFGLNFFAENHFSRETIFKHPEPYNTTFVNFRFAGDIGYDFNLILDDLQNQIQMKYKNSDENDIFYNKKNIKLFEEIGITETERKVLELYLKNTPTKEIAQIFVVAENTINAHIKSIRNKFKEHFDFDKNANIKQEIKNIIMQS